MRYVNFSATEIGRRSCYALAATCSLQLHQYLEAFCCPAWESQYDGSVFFSPAQLQDLWDLAEAGDNNAGDAQQELGALPRHRHCPDPQFLQLTSNILVNMTLSIASLTLAAV